MSGIFSNASDATIEIQRRKQQAQEDEREWRQHSVRTACDAHRRWQARQRKEKRRIERAIKRQMANTSQFEEAIALDPVKHKQRLDRLYDRYMQVYEDGLASEDEKTRIKCADILRGMHIGGIGVGEPATDARNSEIAVLGFLPDVLAGPTLGQLKNAEEEDDEEYVDDEVEEPLAQEPIQDEPGVQRLPAIEEEWEDRYD